jgi:hypothetical protein
MGILSDPHLYPPKPVLASTGVGTVFGWVDRFTGFLPVDMFLPADVGESTDATAM